VIQYLEEVMKRKEAKKQAASNDYWPLDGPPRTNPGDLSIDAADLELEIWEIFNGKFYKNSV
jgi:hypothetical protein